MSSISNLPRKEHTDDWNTTRTQRPSEIPNICPQWRDFASNWKPSAFQSGSKHQSRMTRPRSPQTRVFLLPQIHSTNLAALHKTSTNPRWAAYVQKAGRGGSASRHPHGHALGSRAVQLLMAFLPLLSSQSHLRSQIWARSPQSLTAKASLLCTSKESKTEGGVSRKPCTPPVPPLNFLSAARPHSQFLAFGEGSYNSSLRFI